MVVVMKERATEAQIDAVIVSNVPEPTAGLTALLLLWQSTRAGRIARGRAVC